MSHSNSRGNKKKRIRVYKIKEGYITKSTIPYQKDPTVTMEKVKTCIKKK